MVEMQKMKFAAATVSNDRIALVCLEYLKSITKSQLKTAGTTQVHYFRFTAATLANGRSTLDEPHIVEIYGKILWKFPQTSQEEVFEIKTESKSKSVPRNAF